jgi:hypothetical protein
LLNIKELSDMIDIAQDTVYDQNLYYEKDTQTILFETEDFEIDEFEKELGHLLLIHVEPFGREMFLAFFETIANPTVREMFRDRFHGSKKYRKVKDLFPRYHLLEAFYQFKDQYQLEIARSWCKKNGINYIDIDGKEVIVSTRRE